MKQHAQVIYDQANPFGKAGHLEIRVRRPQGATVWARDRDRDMVLVSGKGLRGGLDWFADDVWTRVLRGYDDAPDKECR